MSDEVMGIPKSNGFIFRGVVESGVWTSHLTWDKVKGTARMESKSKVQKV